MARKSPAYSATEKLLKQISSGKPIVECNLDGRIVKRLIDHINKKERVGGIKEVRALAQCGLKEALDLHDKYIRGN